MTSEYALQMLGVTKTFGSVVANRDVSFRVRKGEVHALVGENGAGKSTLMKILFGLYQPDAGEIYIHGQRVAIVNSADAIKLGIGMVHQHFMLIPDFTVAENMVLGVEPVAGKRLDMAKAKADVRRLAKECGFDIDPDARIRDCSVGVQQRVEIMKALYRGADILILDEPTSVLTPDGVQELFAIMRSLTAQGKTIIFISHKLPEVMSIAQHVTVLRKGETVANLSIDETNEEELALLMVGRKVELYGSKDEVTLGKPILEARNLWAQDQFGNETLKDVSLTVHEGEIYGIAGVAQNGQEELVDVLMGLKTPMHGSIQICGTDCTGKSPAVVRSLGVGYIPEDRYERAIIRDASVQENLLLGLQRDKNFNEFFLRFDQIEKWAQKRIEDFSVQPPYLKTSGGSLSGGNAQRVVMAREFYVSQKVIIVCQPSHGLDIGSIDFVHRQLLERRRQGYAIVLVSSDLDEMLYLADTIAVMYRGQILEEFPNKNVSKKKLGLLMAGIRATDQGGKPCASTKA